MLSLLVPLVEINGLNLVQSNAAVRYFAKQGDLMGDSLVDQTHADILYEGTRDFLSFFMSYGFQGWESVLESAKAKALPKFGCTATHGLKNLEISNQCKLRA